MIDRRNQCAAPELRDRFLQALESSNRAAAIASAQPLTTCSNPLPSGTCIELGLPLGSCYAEAATLVLKRVTNSRASALHFPALAKLAKDYPSPF